MTAANIIIGKSCWIDNAGFGNGAFFAEHTVVGETRQSWIIRKKGIDYGWADRKVLKRDTSKTTRGTDMAPLVVFWNESEKDQHAWHLANRYAVNGAVAKLDAEMIRAVARLIGYKPAPP